MPVRNATTPVTVFADAIFATSDTSRSMPCVRSTSAISTVTPHTITMTRHGIRLIASPSSADRDSTSTTAPRNAPMPTLTRAKMTLRINVAMTPSVIQWRRLKRPSDPSSGSVRRSAAGAEELEAAEERVAAERDHRVRGEIVEIGLQLETRTGRFSPSGRSR